MKHRVLVLNGANLNMLGKREVSVYGTQSLDSILADLQAFATSVSVDIHGIQSNHEGVLIDALHQAFADSTAGIIINAGAYTHTSIALHDALRAVSLPTVEVHISNIYAREPFRHTSLLSPVVLGVIAGFGVDGYRLALQGLLPYL